MLTISDENQKSLYTLESSLDTTEKQGVIYPLQPSQLAFSAFSR